MLQQYLEFAAHHPGLFAALAGVLSLLIANEVHGHLTGGKRLSAPEAVRFINDRDPVIVDLRAPGDFKRSHLLGAVNLPLAKLEDRLGELGKDKSRPVLLYDALGGGGVEAVARLKKHGFTEAYPLGGGLNGWLGANLPVTAK